MKNELNPIFKNVWDSIKDAVDSSFDINFNKLNRQLEIHSKFTHTYQGKGVLEAVTGFGKTFNAIIAILRINRMVPNAVTNVVVPNTNLHNDWTDPEYGYINVYHLHNVRVYVVNTYTMQSEKHFCTFLVLDEIHRYLGKDAHYFNKVIDMTQHDFLLGLSATLDAAEKKELLKRDIPIIDTISVEEAEHNGWISKFKIYNIGVEDNDKEKLAKINDMFNQYHSYFNFDFNLAMACNKPNDLFYKNPITGVSLSGRQWREKHAKSLGWTPAKGDHDKWSPKSIRTKAGLWFNFMNERVGYLHSSPEKLNMAELIINTFRDKKTIVFTERTSIADDLYQRLGGISQLYHSNVPTSIFVDDKIIAYKTGTDEFQYIGSELKDNWDNIKAKNPNAVKIGSSRLRKKIKDDFNDNKFRVLISSKALDEGFDCKDIEMGIIHSGSGGKRQSVQRMGRVLRSYGDKEAVIFNIFVKDSQDEKWLKKRQKGISLSKIHNIKSLNEVNLNEEEEQILVSYG